MLKINSAKKTFLLITVFFLLLILIPTTTHAATSYVCKGGSIFDFFTDIRDTGESDATIYTDPYTLVSLISCAMEKITSFLLEIALGVSALIVAISGIRYTMSAGDPKKQQDAIRAINAAIIGFILLMLFMSLFNFVLTFFDVVSLTG